MLICIYFQITAFKCGKCNEPFEQSRELSYHMRTEHKERISHRLSSYKHRVFECYICKDIFKSGKKMREHFRMHSENGKCIVCCEKFEDGQLDEHLCIQQEYICCEYCPKKFVTTKSLLKHLENVHANRKTYRCAKCSQKFRMLFLKMFHQECHDKINSFVCTICSKAFALQSTLVNHGKTHMNHHNIECMLHVYNFHYQLFTLFQIMIIIMITVTRFLCELCGKELKSISSLKKHRLSHEEPKIKCSDCPQMFCTMGSLKRHSDIHRNTKYFCSICGAETSSATSLRKHMRNYQIVFIQF